MAKWSMGALLLNPDVVTFWNMRRELVKAGRLDPLQELRYLIDNIVPFKLFFFLFKILYFLFRFATIVLYHKAKSFEAFSYRRWLLRYLLVDSKLATLDIETILKNEVQVASMAADRYKPNSIRLKQIIKNKKKTNTNFHRIFRYPSNCYAWSHREYVVSKFQQVASSSFTAFLREEWQGTHEWCEKHVSDHSGHAYRQFLLKNILLNDENCSSGSSEVARRREVLVDYVSEAARDSSVECVLRDGNCRQLLDLLHGTASSTNTSSEAKCAGLVVRLSYWAEECKFNEDTMRLFPGHETLWYHRRYLAHALLRLIDSYKKYSTYGPSFSQQQRSATDDSNSTKEPQDKCLLIVAFEMRNHNVIKLANNQQQSFLVDRFVKFVSELGLEV